MMFKLSIAALLSLSLAVGCDSADRAYDCASICNKYKDCADADYDVTACTSRCRDNASKSEDFEDKADECQECVDDRSCVGAAFGCATECIGIVP